jgi:hypothetical protein
MRKLFILIFVLVFVAACGGKEPPPVVNIRTVESENENENANANANTPEEEITITEVETGITPMERPAGVVYSLATDAWLQNANVGDSGDVGIFDGSPYFRQSGNPAWVVTDRGVNETNAIRISRREYPADTMELDIITMDFLRNDNWRNNSYMLTVKGRTDGPATMCIFGVNGVNVFDSVEINNEDGGEFFLWTMLDQTTIFADDEWLGVIRFGTYPETVDIFIDELMISETTNANYPRAENVLYSLSTDPLIQQLEVGTRGFRNVFVTPHLVDAGNPTYTIVEGPFGNAIQMTNREHDYYAVDFITQIYDWDFENYSYILSLHGHLRGGEEGLIGGADSPWRWLAPQPVDDEGNFIASTLIDSYTSLEDAGSRQWFRLRSACINPMTIYEITLERQ